MNFNYTFAKQLTTEPNYSALIDRQNRRYYPYIPSDDLVEAVNLAIKLQRPLLLEGEPGCGKTQLASNLVFQLTRNNLAEEMNRGDWWPFYIWNVKSYTRARDGLYTFEAVERLRDAQMVGTNLVQTLDPEQIKKIQTRVQDPKSYRKFGALGNAIREKGKRAVVLIDEVDKADSDFANDLLLELDQFRFDIPETDEMDISATERPIIILTSNREKPLPDAFLRRCLYFSIKFPSDKELEDIAKKRFSGKDKLSQKLLLRSIKVFTQVRQSMTAPGSKPPGTSEFLEFIQALSDLSEPERTKILDRLFQNQAFLGILLKTLPDQELYIKTMSGRDVT
jgi:MoxR-like ATPase